jgi:hypothetical protein
MESARSILIENHPKVKSATMAGGKSSKNNPDARGEKVQKRKYKNKDVNPVLFIGEKGRYMAAAYDGSGELVTDPNTKQPIPHANI